MIKANYSILYMLNTSNMYECMDAEMVLTFEEKVNIWLGFKKGRRNQKLSLKHTF